jgi:CPA2 family monovalent cation:H+ antiporter-2
MFTAATLLLVIGIAWLMTVVGLSPALGTFLAGVVLANSEFRHELESDIEPFKGLLLGLFFITVGAGIDFAILLGDFTLILGATLGVMATKALVLLGLARLFRLKGRDQILFTLGLAQAGEFGFVLIGYAVQTNVLPLDLSAHLLLVVALSMLLTPLLFILTDVASRWHRPPDRTEPPDEIDARHAIILAGAGRFGQVVNRMLAMNGLKATVLDHDIDTIRAQRKFGLKGFYGDPTRPELLHAAGLMTADVLVVALDDRKAAVKLVAQARRERPDIHIIARARDRGHVYELYAAGANQIVRETFDSSIRVGKYVLKRIGIPAYEVEQAAADFFDLDREVLKEMAALWDPDVPATENAAFMRRAREYNEALVTSFADTEDED